MALEFMHGFDDIANSTELALRWTQVQVFNTLSVITGRFSGSSAIRCIDANASITLPGASKATRIYGFAVRFVTLPASAVTFLELLDGGTSQTGIAINPAGTISAMRGSTVLGTTSATVSPNTWAFIEAKVTNHSTSGVVVVKLNGSTVLNLSAINTQSSGNASHDRARIQAGGSNIDYDDFYVLNTDGAAPNNDFIGEKRIETKLPDGAGNYAQFSPSAGSNYQNVDDATPDDDTTYNSSGTAGQRDSFTFADFAVAGTISGVQVNVYARKDDAATREMKAFLRRSSTDTDGATTHAMASSYRSYPQIWETDPNTSAAWSLANVNATEFGYKVQT